MEFKDLKELVYETRTVHQFDKAPYLSPDDLEDVIEMSLYAPNHRLTYPWHILHVGEATRQKLAALARELAREKGKDEEAMNAAMDKVMAPSGLLVYLLEKKPDKPREEREDYATLACSIQLLALGLQSHGWHYKWSTGGLSQHRQSYDILGVDSHTHEIVGFIWVGKPTQEVTLKPRPSVNEVVRHI